MQGKMQETSFWMQLWAMPATEICEVQRAIAVEGIPFGNAWFPDCSLFLSIYLHSAFSTVA